MLAALGRSVSYLESHIFKYSLVVYFNVMYDEAVKKLSLNL